MAFWSAGLVNKGASNFHVEVSWLAWKNPTASLHMQLSHYKTPTHSCLRVLSYNFGQKSLKLSPVYCRQHTLYDSHFLVRLYTIQFYVQIA